ncbi:hypothetical protein ACFLYX_01580 [Chloroflexota bacterium]
MAEELGKIEKPEAMDFKGKRKLFLVPLLFSWDDAPEEYKEKFNLYWQQVGEHLIGLEEKVGKVMRVYHESVTMADEDGLRVLENFNPSSYRIVQDKCQNGAQFEVTEDKELAEESVDWERHLLLGFVSPKVAKVVSDSFVEASRKRYEYIAGIVDKTLKENEAALLLIRENHLVQFPQDIEVFSVAPPVLDEIHRWLRDRSLKREEPEE